VIFRKFPYGTDYILERELSLPFCSYFGALAPTAISGIVDEPLSQSVRN